MNKVHLLGANRSYDRDEQTVSVNQVVMLEGYSYDSYVVYEVSRSQWGITYHLINLRTHEFHTSDLIRPLSEKFRIGMYYDDANPKFWIRWKQPPCLPKRGRRKRRMTEKRRKNGRGTNTPQKSDRNACAPLSHRMRKPSLSVNYG